MPPRPGFRPRLAGLMLLIGAIAADFGLMREGSEVAASIASAVLHLTLAVGLLGTIVRRGSGPWVGFSLFGWGYAALAFTPIARTLDLPPLPTIGPIEWVAGRLDDARIESFKTSFKARLGEFGNDLKNENFQVQKKSKDGSWGPLAPDDQAFFDAAMIREQVLQADKASSVRGELGQTQRIGHATLTLIVAGLGAWIGKALERPGRSGSALIQAGG